MLEEMWEAQQRFYRTIRDEKASMTDQEFCHSIVLHLHKEVSELLDAVGGPWKTHVKEATALRKSQILMEVVDIGKLSWEVAIAAGVTAEEYHEAFMQKSLVVEWRRSNEKLLDNIKKTKCKVIVFDFDGVIVRYPEGFLDYVASKVEYVKRVEDLTSPDDLWTQLGISLDDYQRLKKDFIENGGLRKLPAILESFKLLDYVKHLGYKIVIVTSRDKSTLEKMELDTYRWVNDHGLDDIIDGVFFSTDKARFIKAHFENVTMVIEDHAFEVRRLREAGMNAVLVDRPYNKDGLKFDEIKVLLGNIECD